MVLDYLKKELPNNSELSDKLLTFKVAILLALTSASQSKWSSHFRYQVYGENFAKVCFQISQTTYILETSEKSTTLEIVAFSQDKDPCVVSALNI